MLTVFQDIPESVSSCVFVVLMALEILVGFNIVVVLRSENLRTIVGLYIGRGVMIDDVFGVGRDWG